MPLAGGIKMQLGVHARKDESEQKLPEPISGPRSYATSGRKRACTSSDFLTSMYLAGHPAEQGLGAGKRPTISLDAGPSFDQVVSE